MAQGFLVNIEYSTQQSGVIISPGSHTNPHTHSQMRHKPVETVVSQSREHTSALVEASDTPPRFSSLTQIRTPDKRVGAAKLRSQAQCEAALKFYDSAVLASNYASAVKMQIIVT